MVAAIILDALAYRALEAYKAQAARKVTGKGIVLSLVSGVLMGSFFPLVEIGKAEERGLGPYAIGFVFAVGVFLSTFVFNLFFMNMPVEGPPVAMSGYFKGRGRQHLLGIVGGLIWATGTIANFTAASAPEKRAGGPGDQLRDGPGRHHGERAVGSAAVERIRRSGIARAPAGCDHADPVCEWTWPGFCGAIVRQPLRAPTSRKAGMSRFGSEGQRVTGCGVNARDGRLSKQAGYKIVLRFIIRTIRKILSREIKIHSPADPA